MGNIQKLNDILRNFYPDLPFKKKSNEGVSEQFSAGQESNAENILNPFAEKYKDELYAKTINEAIEQIDAILAEINEEETKSISEDTEQVEGGIPAGEEMEVTEIDDEEPCCFDDEDDEEMVFYAPSEDDFDYELEGEGKTVEGVLVPESEFDNLVNEGKEAVLSFLEENFELPESFDIYEDLEIYTPDFYYGVPDGYVLVSVRKELLSEAVKKRRKSGGRMVLRGRIVTGAKRIRLKIYRKRYYRRKKARLRIKQHRARVRRKVRGGRVSQREYRRERSMRTTGTLRRKHQVLKPGRKGFKTLTKEGEKMEGRLIWEALSEYVPSAKEYRNLYYTILNKALEKAALYVEENNRIETAKVLNLFEKYFNSLTSVIARDLSSKYITEEDGEYTEYELKQLEAAYNDFVDYINDLLAELRQYLAVRDFDSADEVLYDLRDSIDDFFGYLYGDTGEEDFEEDFTDEDDFEEETEPFEQEPDETWDTDNDTGDEEYVIPISGEEEESESSEEGNEDEEEK